MWRFDFLDGRIVHGALIKVPSNTCTTYARFIQVYSTKRGVWTTTLIHLDSPANSLAFMEMCTPYPAPSNDDNTSVDGYDTMIENAHAHVAAQHGGGQYNEDNYPLSQIENTDVFRDWLYN